MEPGLWALLPLVVTLLVAFLTRSAMIGMLLGVFVGTLMSGSLPGSGLDRVFRSALGNGEFIWICEIVILIGILFELFRRAGVLAALGARVPASARSPRRVGLTAWGMGLLIIDDYLSPLLAGAVMRPLSDRAAMPREKLAFILDSTTAPVCILVPFTAWGAYVAGLIAAQGGPAATADAALAVFIAAIPWNFYPLLLILFTLLVAARLVPDFGPMRRAERRVAETGLLLRPGAKPLLSQDDHLATERARRPLLIPELLVPVMLLVGVGVSSLLVTGSVRIVEAFMAADTWLLAVLWFRGDIRRATGVGDVIVSGTRNVMDALLVVALAYALNAVTRELGAATVIVGYFPPDVGPNVLVASTFLATAALSFATGTSWGAFAMMMPVALPVAYHLTGDTLTPLVYQTVAAVAGGGIFGDHASPVSDTTVLSSLGAGSDHIDHVVTQLPYALSIAAVTLCLYLVTTA